MHRFCIAFLVLCLTGCASVSIPNYIKDENPYQKTFYASFDRVRSAAMDALKESGWAIERESDPALFEVGRSSDDGDNQHTVLFTKIRQISFFVGSRYARLNVFISSAPDGSTEMEIRYLNVSTLQVKTLHDYTNDQLVEKLFTSIDEKIK